MYKKKKAKEKKHKGSNYVNHGFVSMNELYLAQIIVGLSTMFNEIFGDQDSPSNYPVGCFDLRM